MTNTLTEARAERDAAIAQVTENADEKWKREGIEALRRVAARQSQLTADDVWEELDAAGVERPREPRAMVSVMLGGQKAGIITMTGEYAGSVRRHASPVRVWRSLLKAPGNHRVNYIRAGSLVDHNGDPMQVVPVRGGVTADMLDRVTDEQWKAVLGAKMLNMKGYVRIRAKRIVRLLLEGKVYDDPKEDGRKLTKEERNHAHPG